MMARWKPIAAIIALIVVFLSGYYVAHVACERDIAEDRAKAEQVIAEMAQAEAAAVERARKAERTLQSKIDEIGSNAQKRIDDAQKEHDRVIADLRSGTVKLRREWAGCETDGLSSSAEAAGKLDAAAEVRERLAAEIVSVGARADAQVMGLQEYARAVSKE